MTTISKPQILLSVKYLKRMFLIWWTPKVPRASSSQKSSSRWGEYVGFANCPNRQLGRCGPDERSAARPNSAPKWGRILEAESESESEGEEAHTNAAGFRRAEGGSVRAQPWPLSSPAPSPGRQRWFSRLSFPTPESKDTESFVRASAENGTKREQRTNEDTKSRNFLWVIHFVCELCSAFSFSACVDTREYYE